MTSLLIRNAVVLTFDAKAPVLYDHAVLIEGTKIKKIAPDSEFADFKGKTIDARGRIVMPGYINAHMHYYSTMVRGLGKAEPASNFMGVLENLWWRLDKKLTLEDSYYSALIPMIDAVKNGTTTLIDHHASPFAVTGSLDVIAKAGKEVGLRNCLCYEVSDRDGEKIAEEGLAENEAFIKRCEKENDDMLRALYGLHASFTVSDKTLQKAVDFVKAHNTGFHVHTAEAAGMEPKLLNAVEAVNARQKLHMAERIKEYFAPQGGVKGKTLALWGLAFKANTDDMREAAAINIINALTEAGMKVRAFDPVAADNARRIFQDNPLVEIVDDQYGVCDGAQALLVVTEWNQFRNPDFDRIKSLLTAPLLFDGRNLYSPAAMGSRGFAYFCIGRRPD